MQKIKIDRVYIHTIHKLPPLYDDMRPEYSSSAEPGYNLSWEGWGGSLYKCTSLTTAKEVADKLEKTVFQWFSRLKYEETKKQMEDQLHEDININKYWGGSNRYYFLKNRLKKIEMLAVRSVLKDYRST